METLLITLVGIVLSAVFGYLVKLAKDKVKNEDLEKLLVNGISYAEEVASAYAKGKIQGIEYKGKMATAKEYIDKIDPKVIKKYGDKVEILIERKLGQVEGVGASDYKAIKDK